MRPPTRPIRRILVANRGEIAIRILQAIRELPLAEDGVNILTFAIYTQEDFSHCEIGAPDHSILLPSASCYMDIPFLINIAKEHSIDAIHPGYGFLSESSEFSRRLWEEAGVHVIGPGWELLEQMSDKLQAKRLAAQCDVPVLPAMGRPSGNLSDIEAFVDGIGGYPIMIKAVDGGGGRGIRLVCTAEELPNALERAQGESPSKTVFAEKAAVDGFHHVEVQIIGDGSGEVMHVWERDCSVQRRFQKIVEIAPSAIEDRALIDRVIDAAVRMAKHARYFSLGTFEFLVNDLLQEFYFLEINPRLQVEHTITECISDVDLVQTQLLLAQGATLTELQSRYLTPGDRSPRKHSIQLRLCAEDPESNFGLSIGTITQLIIPGGLGVRVDSHVSARNPTKVGPDYDNLLAKIIVTAQTWNSVVRKARRLLADVVIAGVKTNLSLLRGIVNHEDFLEGRIDTQWLEKNVSTLIEVGNVTGERQLSQMNLPSDTSRPSLANLVTSSSSVLFRKGDAWSLTLEPLKDQSSRGNSRSAIQSHLLITRVLRNDFPSSLTAEIEYSSSSSSSNDGPGVPSTSTQRYRIHLAETNASALALTSLSHRRGDPSNKNHIIFPLSGKLIEVLVAPGDEIVPNQVVAFVKQMKMELEIRSHRAGIVRWVFNLAAGNDAQVSSSQGVDVAEGSLLLELEEQEGIKGKL
ncbi:uncharacterized protein BHQ10_009360 [Talaromyces amestolkiae]|uniref:Pyruvate carboxylase n=1 Tax=Talaromyces amestolkiae TaxID=1196081 RepID=A0A364LC21_TALAM|nr:uncharacterized protein BHQ10_009360 [Talaromyces amestolkiae]RAO73348.1 hypothetical protein BHQ10_009360 [Talaromyces amestolkiae]